MKKSFFVVLSFVFFFNLPLHADETVKIGVSLGLTGKYKYMSQMKKRAYLLWQKDINKKGGLMGKKVDLIIHDDQSSTDKAKELYTRLILEEKVDLILGPYSSGINGAILPITEKYKYPLLASGAAADKLWQKGYKYFFGVYIPTSRYTQAFLELLLRHEHTELAIVHADDPFATGIAEGARKWALRFGMNVLMFESFKKGTRNLDNLARKAKETGAEVLIMGGHFNESVDMRRSLKNIGWTPKAYYASSGPTMEKFHEVLNEDSEFVFSSSQWEPHALSSFPGADKFTDDFIAAYKIKPTYHASSAYAAGQILEAAVKRAGSLDRKLIRDVLSALDIMTIMGRYGVDRTGVQIRHISLIIQWQNGVKQIVAPEELMTSDVVFK